MPLFKDSKKLERDALFWHQPHNRKGIQHDMGSVILSRNCKLYQSLGVNPSELFNLQDDPREKDNVLAANPEVAERLSTQLDQWLKR